MLWVELFPPKLYVEGLKLPPPPHPTQYLRTCPYFEIGSLQIQSVKIRSYWSRVGPESNMIGVLIKGEIWRQIQTQDHIWMTGLIQPQATELAEARRNLEQILPQHLQRDCGPDTLILDFQPRELWDNTFLLLKSPHLWYFAPTALANESISKQTNEVVFAEGRVPSRGGHFMMMGSAQPCFLSEGTAG